MMSKVLFPSGICQQTCQGDMYLSKELSAVQNACPLCQRYNGIKLSAHFLYLVQLLMC